MNKTHHPKQNKMINTVNQLPQSPRLVVNRGNHRIVVVDSDSIMCVEFPNNIICYSNSNLILNLFN